MSRLDVCCIDLGAGSPSVFILRCEMWLRLLALNKHTCLITVFMSFGHVPEKTAHFAQTWWHGSASMRWEYMRWTARHSLLPGRHRVIGDGSS